ncbi:MAG: hypothetical protein ACXVLQ_00550 [Bacteriovorax sp.]
MDYDFNISKETLRIPKTAYQPIKRCPYCQSVFINERSCEACGRSMLYHPIGVPFGPKSFYGMKERYMASQNVLNRFFPQFENRNSSIAKSYVRNISKRFADLALAFNSSELIKADERRLFYVESMGIIDELLRYNVHPQMIQSLLEENDNSLVGQELLLYLQNARKEIRPDLPWQKGFLEHRLWGLIRVEFFLKVTIVTAAVLTMAVTYKEIISSQFGK